MGAWGTGPFDNDTALDWCADLEDAGPARCGELLHGKLAEVAGTRGYLEAPEAEEAVASAALVASRCPGAAPAPASGPQHLPALDSLRVLASEALTRVLADSCELGELWAESGDGAWREGLERLRRILDGSEPTPATDRG